MNHDESPEDPAEGNWAADIELLFGWAFSAGLCYALGVLIAWAGAEAIVALRGGTGPYPYDFLSPPIPAVIGAVVWWLSWRSERRRQARRARARNQHQAE